MSLTAGGGRELCNNTFGDATNMLKEWQDVPKSNGISLVVNH